MREGLGGRLLDPHITIHSIPCVNDRIFVAF